MDKKQLFDRVNSLTQEVKRKKNFDKSTIGRDIYYFIIKSFSNEIDVEVGCHIYEPKIDEDTIDVSFTSQSTELLKSDPSILDSLYRNIMEGEEYLNTHGQFFTPTEIADFMTSLEIDYKDKVLDPACGPSVFLDYVHKNNDNCDLVGVDRDALMVLASRLRSNVSGFDDNSSFTSSDYLTEYESDDEYDVIIGNPPYNRFQNYDGNKQNTFKIEDKYNLGDLANLYSHFFVRSNSLVSDNGHIIFLTPIEYLQTEYGKPLKQLFLDNYKIKEFVKIDWDENIFDAMTTLCVTVLQKCKDTKDNTVNFYVSESSDSFNADDRSKMKRTQIQQDELNKDDKWTRYFIDIENLDYLEQTVKLEEIADTKRGIATGYNDYFTLTASERDKHEIQQTYLKPVLTKAAYAKNYIFNRDDFQDLKLKDRKSYLMYYDDQEVSEELSSYIKYGEKIDADERYLTRNRDPWYSMESRDPAPILATVFSQDDMRFIYNEKQVLTLAAFHGIYPEKTEENWIKALLAYLNSDIALELAKTQHREYSDGLSKFEPNDLSNLPIIDLRKISEENIKELSSLFDRLDQSRREGDETEVRSELNQKVSSLFDEYSEN